MNLLFTTSLNGDNFNIYESDGTFYLEHYGWTSGIYKMYNSKSYIKCLRTIASLKK